MFVLANLITALTSILDIILKALQLLIVIRALLSWVSPDPNNNLVQFIYKVTEPILYPIRKLLPVSLKFGLDISPVIAFLAIIFLQRFLLSTLGELASRLSMG